MFYADIRPQQQEYRAVLNSYMTILYKWVEIKRHSAVNKGTGRVQD